MSLELKKRSTDTQTIELRSKKVFLHRQSDVIIVRGIYVHVQLIDLNCSAEHSRPRIL